MQLSQKPKIFSNFFFHFLDLHSILNISTEKKTLIADALMNLRTPEAVVRQKYKKSRFRGPFDK